MSNNTKKEVTVKQDVDSSPEPAADVASDNNKNKNLTSGDSKTPSLPTGKVSSRLNDLRLRWPGSWQDGSRKSAFQPYKPTTVLTNLQRGNIPTETPIPEQTDVGFHHRAGQGEITELDIQQESDVDVLDSSGLSALMWASAYGQVPTVQLLLRHNASVDRKGKEGETALLYAAAGGHSDVVRILLSEGANVDHTDDVGNTALMYAAYGDHPHCTNELLIRGADPTIFNLNGDSAYGLTVQKSNTLVSSQKNCQRISMSKPREITNHPKCNHSFVVLKNNINLNTSLKCEMVPCFLLANQSQAVLENFLLTFIS